MWRSVVFTGLLALVLPTISGVISYKDVQELKQLLRKIECELEDFDVRDEAYMRRWLELANNAELQAHHQEDLAEWKYSTNLTEENSQKLIKAGGKRAKVDRKITVQAHKFTDNKKRLECYSDDTQRQLDLFTVSEDAKDPDVTKHVLEIRNKMLEIYNKGKVCRDSTCYDLEPDLDNILARSRDPEEILWAWKGWRDAVGSKIGKLYPIFVEKINIGARDNGFDDYSDFWKVNQFGRTKNLEKMLDDLWLEVKPVYQQLHAYVHRKLIEKYGNKVAGYEGEGIPAHLLGNMWAQQWDNILDIVAPYPEVRGVNITQALIDQEYTPERIFQTAEDFFTSIGFPEMTDIFWEKSLIKKPTDRLVVCHGSASDMFAKDDFRIKMCTENTEESFMTVHHEMGHIEYFMVYAHQPFVYRAGANSGFHEAVGDTIALSVSSRKHLKKIGILDKGADDKLDGETKYKIMMNSLMRMALQKIAFLPFGYMIDKWRWDVFRGHIKPESYNEKWWEHILKYQGLVSPVTRESNDFDPGAKFHIPDNDYYVCYFASFVLQFQFYEALCKESGHTGPLHECDFYQSMKAGKKLKDMLSLGASKPWTEALKELTGTDKIDSGSLKRYFEPLLDWLKKENEGKDVDWDHGTINFKHR